MKANNVGVGKTISIRMQADIKGALKKLAFADQRSRSSYVELVLEVTVAVKKNGDKWT